MKKLKKEKTYLLLFFIAIIVRLFFYLSAAKTHWLDQFFLPITSGQDFFQVPNGARSFLRGGDFQGNVDDKENVYIDCCGVNKNVYHPFFTLLIGLPLQFLPPWTAYYSWLALHFLADAAIVYFLFKKFGNHKLFLPAVSVFLVSGFGYYEIVNNQFHFLLSTTAFFLLYEISKKKDSLRGAFFYLFGLLVKPIGALWFPSLFLHRFFKVSLIGVFLFCAISLPFLRIPSAAYFFNNLKSTVLESHYPDWNIFYIFDYFDIQGNFVKPVKFLLVGAILFFSLKKKKKTFTALLLWIIYSLAMYQSTFPYHYSVLPPIFALSILLGVIKFNLLGKFSAFLITMPAPLLISSFLKFTDFTLRHRFEKLIFISWSNLGLLFLTISLLTSSFFSKSEN